MKQSALIFFYLVLLVSCDNKDDEIIKLYCITGNWKCVSGIEIINNDTVELFQNGIKYKYWYGDRQDSFTAGINLSIESNGSYHYEENIDGYQADTTEGNIYNYTSNWQLLSTNLSNTHIFLKIHFEYPQIYQEVFKIAELGDTKLVIEARDEFYYMIYTFERPTADCPGNEFSMSAIQTPGEIIGDWKLDKSLYKTNDSSFIKYENDTLYTQYYLFVHNAPDPVKVTDKDPYQLELNIRGNGEILRLEKRFPEIIDYKSYWYWTDEHNPHKRIMFRPTYANGNIWCDYEIDLKGKELFLRNTENNLEMRFVKN